MEYLYHYTNISSLALILSNRTIRFNSLNKMDDLQEQETADIKNLGQFFYVSSWTDDSKESIPMWNMYASKDQGVRIKLRKNPFQLYINSREDLEGLNVFKVEGEGSKKKVLIPFVDMIKKNFYTTSCMNPAGLLYKVEYTDDNDKLYPKVFTQDEKGITFDFKNIGRFKNRYWEFQHEWRYSLLCIPMDYKQGPKRITSNFEKFAINLYNGIAKQPFPFYDLLISNDSFEEMEITLSPWISLGNKVIVQSLLDKYNDKAIIKESMLTGLV